MTDGNEGRDAGRPHGFPTAWELDDEEAGELDEVELYGPPTRSEHAAERYAVPWALPDD
jgi:hypothetical protein